MNYWESVMRAVRSADVVLFILDARMPELSRNIDLEEKLKKSGKISILVFNKVDLISNHRLGELKKKFPSSFFVSSTTNSGIKQLRTKLQILGKKMDFEKLEVGIVGYPNVGKSALTNILLRAAKTKVSPKAGTTTGLQWASSNTFKFLDSPGVIPLADSEIKLGVLGAKNPEKLRDPEGVAQAIISIFRENDIRDLEERYGIKVHKDDDEYDIFQKIGVEKKLMRKGGVVDEMRAAMMIIHDWRSGKLRIKN